MGAGWLREFFATLPPPTGKEHNFTEFSVVGRVDGLDLPDPSGQFAQQSKSWIAETNTVVSLFANIIDSDPRTRRIRAEFDFTRLRFEIAATGALGWADAGARIRISVLDGTTALCSREETLAWTGSIIAGPVLSGSLPTLQLNCTFENPSLGLPVRLIILVETITWSGAGGLASVGQSYMWGDNIDSKVYEVF